jgi:hypothetical protein
MNRTFNAKAAINLTFNNRKSCEAAARVGCYRCGKFFSPSEIVKWTDKNKTAVCPNPDCDADTILPESFDLVLSDELLMKMKKYWL